MSIIPSTDELDRLAMQCKTWRKQNPGKYLPQRYWSRATRLAKQHPPEVVAKRVGIDLHYLRFKLRQIAGSPPKSKTTSSAVEEEKSLFVELPVTATNQIFTSDQPMSMRICDAKGLQIGLAFTGSIQEVFPLVRELIKEK